MGIARKNRRRIVVGDREFLWWVYQDWEEWPGRVLLAVASADKHFIVHYAIEQQGEHRYLLVMGKEFPGLSSERASWAYVRCPVLTRGRAVGPADVRQLIEWSLHTKRDLIKVAYDVVCKAW